MDQYKGTTTSIQHATQHRDADPYVRTYCAWPRPRSLDGRAAWRWSSLPAPPWLTRLPRLQPLPPLPPPQPLVALCAAATVCQMTTAHRVKRGTVRLVPPSGWTSTVSNVMPAGEGSPTGGRALYTWLCTIAAIIDVTLTDETISLASIRTIVRQTDRDTICQKDTQRRPSQLANSCVGSTSGKPRIEPFVCFFTITILLPWPPKSLTKGRSLVAHTTSPRVKPPGKGSSGVSWSKLTVVFQLCQYRPGACIPPIAAWDQFPMGREESP